jgi:heme-degrading monooxygenase HmoA
VLRERAGLGVFSILQLPVLPGRGPELVRRFDELRIFELAGEHAGLRSARLLQPREPDEPFVVVAEWDTAEAYDTWLMHPERARINEELLPLLAGEPRGGLFTAGSEWENG